MAVLVNFKICDNAKECEGIAVCPTGALTWDEKNETIKINNEKCISCGKCEKECPIGAINVAKSQEEYKRIEKEIKNDSRTIKDLFVDRYGAVGISEFFQIGADKIKDKISNGKITLIEMYNPDEAACLLKSIPIKELMDNLPKDTLYYKTEIDEEIMKEYGIGNCPVLLVFKSKELLGKIEGYYTTDEKAKVIEQIEEIVE